MSIQFDIEKFESKSIRNVMGDYWIRVSDQIQVLNRFVYLEWASARIVAGWVPAACEFEWKCMLSKFIWQDMGIADRLRTRKEELSGNQKISIPSRKLLEFVQDTSAADGFMPYLAGWFLETTKALVHAYESYSEALDPIFDAPTLEILNEIIPKKREQIKWASAVVHDAVKDQEVLAAVSRWREYVRNYMLHLGGIDEKQATSAAKPECPIAEAYGPAPRKRAKPKWLKQGSYATVPEPFSNSLKVFMWHYATEIQVVDPMCYVFYGADDMPFEFYLDFSRHIWDETRHHLMGVRRLEQLGFDRKDIPIPYDEDLLKELEFFYAMLTMVGEACSFTRKKKSMDSYYAKGDILSGMTAEIDIVDERTHVKFGKKWTPAVYQQRLGDNSSLDEIVRKVMNRFIEENADGNFDGMAEEEKKHLSQLAFCGKIEFKYLNYDRL